MDTNPLLNAAQSAQNPVPLAAAVSQPAQVQPVQAQPAGAAAPQAGDVNAMAQSAQTARTVASHPNFLHTFARTVGGALIGALEHAGRDFKPALEVASRVVPEIAAGMPSNTPIGGAMHEAGQNVLAQRELRREQTRQDAFDKLGMARAQLDITHTQQLIRNEDEETKDKSAAQGREFAQSFTDAGVVPLASNLTSDELQEGVQSGKFDWKKDAAIHVGNVPEFDTKGNEIGVRAIYAVYPLQEGSAAPQITLNDSQAAFLASNGYPQIISGARMTPQQYYQFFNSASKVNATRARASSDLAEHDLKMAEADEKQQSNAEKIQSAKDWAAFSPYVIAGNNSLTAGMTHLAMAAQQKGPDGTPTPQAAAASQLYGRMLARIGPKNLDALVKQQRQETDLAVKNANRKVSAIQKQLSSAREEARGRYSPVENAAQTPEQFISADPKVQALQSQLDAAQANLSKLSGVNQPPPNHPQVPMIRVQLPDGRSGVVPQDKVQAFLQAHPGSKQAQAPAPQVPAPAPQGQ